MTTTEPSVGILRDSMGIYTIDGYLYHRWVFIPSMAIYTIVWLFLHDRMVILRDKMTISRDGMRRVLFS